MKKLIASLLLCFVLLTPVAVQTLSPVQVREFLSHSRSITEWRENVETVKKFNGGKLPDYWQKEIIDSQYFDGLFFSWDTRLRKTDDQK